MLSALCLLIVVSCSKSKNESEQETNWINATFEQWQLSTTLKYCSNQHIAPGKA